MHILIILSILFWVFAIHKCGHKFEEKIAKKWWEDGYKNDRKRRMK